MAGHRIARPAPGGCTGGTQRLSSLRGLRPAGHLDPGGDAVPDIRRAGPALLAAALLALAAGCGGDGSAGAGGTTSTPATTPGRATTGTAPAAPAPEPEPLPGIPADLAGYETWTRINSRPIPPRQPDPHSGTKNVYASVPAGPDGTFPDGAVVVKDATRPGRDHLGLVAVMRKIAGVDPAHGDWDFIEYARESADRPFTVLAEDGVCWGCHAGAADADWVWTRQLGLDE